MTIAIITIGLMVGTAFLMKNAKKQKTIGGYVLVLVGGIVIFLFQPFIHVLINYTDGGGGIQLASTIFGLYFIGWSIVRFVKFNKEKNQPQTELKK